MRESDFIFYCANLMYYKCHEVDFKCGGLNATSPGWTKKKNATANQKNYPDRHFQYAITIARDYGKNGKIPQIIMKVILLYINIIVME